MNTKYVLISFNNGGSFVYKVNSKNKIDIDTVIKYFIETEGLSEDRDNIEIIDNITELDFDSELKKTESLNFSLGTQVSVTRLDGDQFNHNFTGRVVGYRTGPLVTVEDQDGDCWDCEPSQLKYSSDEIMN